MAGLAVGTLRALLRDMQTQTVYGTDGSKVGVVELEGSEYVAYNLSDIEVYRGTRYTMACWTLQGRA